MFAYCAMRRRAPQRSKPCVKAQVRVRLLAVYCFLAINASTRGADWYVDANASGPAHDGTAWCTAFVYLQDALAVAQTRDTVRVAKGVYHPDRGTGQIPGDRLASFPLLDRVTLEGGYAGCGTMDPNARSFDAYETTLSGDLNDDDGPLWEGNSENSYHVLRASPAGDGWSAGYLEGFTIRGGNANGLGFPSSIHDTGGGLLIIQARPLVTKCRFTMNTAIRSGGAVAIPPPVSHGEPVFVDCSFVDNQAIYGDGGALFISGGSVTLNGCTINNNMAAYKGGAISAVQSHLVAIDSVFAENGGAYFGGALEFEHSTVVATKCTFQANRAPFGGGAIFSSDATINFAECGFLHNIAGGDDFSGDGGAFYSDTSVGNVVNSMFLGNSTNWYGRGGAVLDFDDSNLVFVNCGFSGNWAGVGGAIGVVSLGRPTLVNCTFLQNTAQERGGGFYYDDLANGSSLTNCIFWGNRGAHGASSQIYGEETPELNRPVVNYSVVEGGWAGAGGVQILDTDPRFVDADGADDVIGTEDDNLRLLPGSPAIDAGDNRVVPPTHTTDLDGSARFVDDPEKADTGNGTAPIVDIGAFEFQPDCNQNGVPDYMDLAAVTSPDCNGNRRPDECEIDANSTAPGGPFFCMMNCDPDCNDNGVPDECEVPQSCALPVYCPVTSTWGGHAGVWDDGQTNIDWCLPEAPNNNPDATFTVTIAGPESAVTLNTSPTIEALFLLDGATAEVNDASGANTRTLAVDGTITNTGVLLATDRERLVLDAPFIDQVDPCGEGGTIQAIDGRAAPGEENDKSVVEINGAVVRGGSVVTVGDQSEIHLIGGAELVDTCVSGVVVPDGQAGRFSGIVTNDDVLTVRGTSINTRLEPAGPQAVLEGTGRVQVTNASFARLGDFKETFTNGSQHRIEGAGIVFGGLINQGIMEAQIPDQPLILLPPGRKQNNGQFRASNGGILRISDSVIGAGELLAQGGTIQLRSADENAIVVRAMSVRVSGSPYDIGRVEVDSNAQIILTDNLVVDTGGSYGPVPDDSVPNASQLSARDITLKYSTLVPSDLHAPEMLLSDNMAVTTAADFIIDGTGSVCRGAADGAAAILGGRTPPTTRIRDSATLQVFANCALTGSVSFFNGSSANVVLHGNWDNRCTCPVSFDWLQGGLSLAATAPQLFEVAGQDRGLTSAGFGDGTNTNYAFGRFELSAGAHATLTDQFPNSGASTSDCTEALYTRHLILHAGSELTLDRCRLYYLSKVDDGAVIVRQGCGELVQLRMGDPDADGNVDLWDFAAFQRCFSDGQDSIRAGECFWMDFNADDRVDLSDYSVLRSLMDGR